MNRSMTKLRNVPIGNLRFGSGAAEQENTIEMKFVGCDRVRVSIRGFRVGVVIRTLQSRHQHGRV